jgi:hypothetical protein
MYFFQNTGILHNIKDNRANTLSGKLQFLGIFMGFLAQKLLGIFSLKSGVFRGFFFELGLATLVHHKKSDFIVA